MTLNALDQTQLQECRVNLRHPQSPPFQALQDATTSFLHPYLLRNPHLIPSLGISHPSASKLALFPLRSRSWKPLTLSCLGLPVDSPPWAYTFGNEGLLSCPWDQGKSRWWWLKAPCGSLGQEGKKDLYCFIINLWPRKSSLFSMYSVTFNF